MTDQSRTLTRDDLLALLRQVGELLLDRGVEASVYVVGGAAKNACSTWPVARTPEPRRTARRHATDGHALDPREWCRRPDRPRRERPRLRG